jgi:uncharacterized protein YjbI with pentapeptide repeats
MADEEHLGRLKQGVAAWNQWRKANPNIKPNLTRANLLEATLAEVDFSGVNLTGADLTRANFTEATLTRVDLTKASLWHTILANVDLSTGIGLETVQRAGPSTIGIDTLYRSQGNIPEVFLRGAGVPDEMITYSKSLVRRPFEFYSCFISYSSKDQKFAERLHADLQNKGVRCWFAPEDFKIGEKIRTGIDEAIRSRAKLLLVLSEDSITSTWVEKEVETAFDEERRRKKTVLFPVRLDDAVMETTEVWAVDIRLTRHIGDFRKWPDDDSYQKAFTRLLRNLKAEI